MKLTQIAVAAASVVVFAQPSTAQDKAIALLKGALVVAQDGKGTFLGRIENEFGKESIFNEFSKYGSEFSANSIFNEFGKFGGEFSKFSPFNEFTNTPPMIVKDGKVIGYLTANTTKKGGISVSTLMSLKDRL